ncbi:MAG: DoxX family membrane protein [Paludibacteraceae bacterium]|nr:DoxX family membrane protein [Paludibacteraceae bacterium]
MKLFKHLLGSFARTLLALTFLFSGIVKAVDPLGTTYKIEDYLKAFGGFFTDLLPLAEPAAIALIAVEFILGFCMLLNIKTQWTAWLSLVFYLVMTPLTLYIALNNPVSDCGCFGDALILTNWQTFYKNIILLSLVLILLCCKKEIRETWMPWMEGVWTGVAALAVGGFMAYNLTHLPIWDFRPYKIGNYLPKLMEYPEDAEPDQYDISFVYEKDGVEQEFTLENYPKGDSTWTFVRQNSTLIKKGYEPPIHDFEILNEDYEDITYDILESTDKVTLAVMYDLTKANDKQVAKLNKLYAKIAKSGKSFYAVTGSSSQDIENFRTEYKAQYPICTCDPVTLKTIVRANPGIVEIQNGIVINKYNLRNL